MPEKILFVNKALSQARSMEKIGKFAQAEHIYRKILEQYPKHKLAGKRLDSVRKMKRGQTHSGAGSQSLQAGIESLVKLFNQGRLSEALTQGKALSGSYPGDPTVHNIMGVINARIGQAELALACYDRALAIKPDFAEVHNNRGNVLNRLGQNAEAIASFRKALQIKPEYAEAHNNLGVALYDAGELDQATASYREALTVRPSYAEAQNNLGNALADLGQPEIALASFSAALQLNPRYFQAHYNRGNVLRSMGRHDEAIDSFNSAIGLRPDYAEAFNSLGNTLNEQGKHPQAIDNLTRAIQLRPDYSEAHCNLGNALSDSGRPDEALPSYRTALQIKPGFAEAQCCLGNALNDLGRREEAIDSYCRALELESDHAAAFNTLSQIKTYERDDPQIDQMQKLLANPDLSETKAMHLGFALGKVHDDLGDVDQAFKHYQEGNRLKKKTLGYHISSDQARFKQIKLLFSSYTQKPGQGIESGSDFKKQPIFIVGMPRSGTTLVEQILASHSGVFGAGELETLGRTMNPLLREKALGGQSELGETDLVNLRNSYLEEINQLPGSEPFVTDKMPINFRWVGFLLLAMPGVKVINLRRDPAAVCWSIFKHHIGGGGNAYSYDILDVAEYYNLYADLMEFWRQAFPDQIYDLDYESLTENQEQETRHLLEYCGLDWEDQCLDFHKTRRSVQTLSARQVRKAMYTGSSRVWRKYETHLQPMLEALGIEPRGPDVSEE
ncbi:MAG: tetratricopeptide repeat protein [Xanthomonadales bacterium]|nr:tetratricopeptide repeat protein [Xanthomonadales bacterium]